jgi:hypothetical protein
MFPVIQDCNFKALVCGFKRRLKKCEIKRPRSGGLETNFIKR